jgi:hypothetical protein
MKSIGVYFNEVILNNRRFLISWLPKFKELYSQLESNPNYNKKEVMNLFLKSKIVDIISNIDSVVKQTQLLEKAQHELKDFLLKKK